MVSRGEVRERVKGCLTRKRLSLYDCVRPDLPAGFRVLERTLEELIKHS